MKIKSNKTFECYESAYESWINNGKDITLDGVKLVPITTLDEIRAEITAIAINRQVDEHTAFIRTGEQVKQMALNIIDKYRGEES